MLGLLRQIVLGQASVVRCRRLCI